MVATGHVTAFRYPGNASSSQPGTSMSLTEILVIFMGARLPDRAGAGLSEP